MAQLASLKDYLAIASTVRFYVTASFERGFGLLANQMAGHSMWELCQIIRDLFHLETPVCQDANMSHRHSLK